MTKFEIVAQIESLLGQPSTRLWRADKITLQTILIAVQTLHDVPACCARCGVPIHYAERVWLDDGSGEGCTDDNGIEGIHAIL